MVLSEDITKVIYLLIVIAMGQLVVRKQQCKPTSLAALPGVTQYSTLTVNVSPSCSLENTKAVLSPARECSAQ